MPGQTGFEEQIAELKLDASAGIRTIYTEQEQIELSACIIGANPNALLKAKAITDQDYEFLSLRKRDAFDTFREQLGADKVDTFLAAFGLGPKYVPKEPKKYGCWKCGGQNAVARELHEDVPGLDDIYLVCPDCGFEDNEPSHFLAAPAKQANLNPPKENAPAAIDSGLAAWAQDQAKERFIRRLTGAHRVN
jgi:hypothetical protein